MVSRSDYMINSQGVSLSASLLSPDGKGPHPGLIICHGMPSTPRSSQLDIGGHANVSDQGITYLQLAEIFAWDGFATVIFNFRGTGHSTGNFHYSGWVEDLKSVISWASNISTVDKGQIVLLGSSLGAAIAIYVSAVRDDVAGLISFASPAVFGRRSDPEEDIKRLRDQGLIRDPDFPESTEEWASEGVEISPMDWVGRIHSKPILLLHGDSDETVSVSNVHSLFEAASDLKEINILPGVGHRFRSEHLAVEAARDWLGRNFPSKNSF